MYYIKKSLYLKMQTIPRNDKFIEKLNRKIEKIEEAKVEETPIVTGETIVVEDIVKENKIPVVEVPVETGVTVDEQPGEEKIIITMTTWKDRIENVPTVLETMLKQTKKADKIVINLSSEEFENKENDFPDNVKNFLHKHDDLIELNWIDGPNTKQWKKIIPTLKLYPNDCIICIDDDFLYPDNLIVCMWNAHLRHPQNPISGNALKHQGAPCHCGCASLVKLEYLNGIFDMVTDDVMEFHSSDIFYTYVAAKAGTPYVYCGKRFFTNMEKFNEISPLSKKASAKGSLSSMWNYLVNKYGKI